TTAIVRLPDAPCPVDEYFLKPAVVRLVGFFVAQMPFAEDPGDIAGPAQYLSQGYGVERHPLPFQDRMRHAVGKLMASAHDGRSCRRTGGAHMKVIQPRADAIQPIEVRGL